MVYHHLIQDFEIGWVRPLNNSKNKSTAGYIFINSPYVIFIFYLPILAIVLNHRNSVKRDHENRRNSLYYTVQKEMLDKLIELSQLYWNCGTNLINMLSEQDEGKKESAAEAYTQILYNMLFKAQEINDYYHSLFENFGISPDCSRVVEVSRIYSEDLNLIYRNYDIVWKNGGCIRAINEKLDIMRDEVGEATGRTREYINDCMGKIAKSMCSQLE